MEEYELRKIKEKRMKRNYPSRKISKKKQRRKRNGRNSFGNGAYNGSRNVNPWIQPHPHQQPVFPYAQGMMVPMWMGGFPAPQDMYVESRDERIVLEFSETDEDDDAKLIEEYHESKKFAKQLEEKLRKLRENSEKKRKRDFEEEKVQKRRKLELEDLEEVKKKKQIEIDNLEDEMKNYRSSMNLLQKDIKDARKNRKGYELSIRRLEEQLQSVRTKFEENESYISSKTLMIEDLKHKLTETEKNIDQAKIFLADLASQCALEEEKNPPLSPVEPPEIDESRVSKEVSKELSPEPIVDSKPVQVSSEPQNIQDLFSIPSNTLSSSQWNVLFDQQVDSRPTTVETFEEDQMIEEYQDFPSEPTEFPMNNQHEEANMFSLEDEKPNLFGLEDEKPDTNPMNQREEANVFPMEDEKPDTDNPDTGENPDTDENLVTTSSDMEDEEPEKFVTVKDACENDKQKDSSKEKHVDSNPEVTENVQNYVAIGDVSTPTIASLLGRKNNVKQSENDFSRWKRPLPELVVKRLLTLSDGSVIEMPTSNEKLPIQEKRTSSTSFQTKTSTRELKSLFRQYESPLTQFGAYDVFRDNSIERNTFQKIDPNIEFCVDGDNCSNPNCKLQHFSSLLPSNRELIKDIVEKYNITSHPNTYFLWKYNRMLGKRPLSEVVKAFQNTMLKAIKKRKDNYNFLDYYSKKLPKKSNAESVESIHGLNPKKPFAKSWPKLLSVETTMRTSDRYYQILNLQESVGGALNHDFDLENFFLLANQELIYHLHTENDINTSIQKCIPFFEKALRTNAGFEDLWIGIVSLCGLGTTENLKNQYSTLIKRGLAACPFSIRLWMLRYSESPNQFLDRWNVLKEGIESMSRSPTEECSKWTTLLILEACQILFQYTNDRQYCKKFLLSNKRRVSAKKHKTILQLVEIGLYAFEKWIFGTKSKYELLPYVTHGFLLDWEKRNPSTDLAVDFLFHGIDTSDPIYILNYEAFLKSKGSEIEKPWKSLVSQLEQDSSIVSNQKFAQNFTTLCSSSQARYDFIFEVIRFSSPKPILAQIYDALNYSTNEPLKSTDFWEKRIGIILHFYMNATCSHKSVLNQIMHTSLPKVETNILLFDFVSFLCTFQEDEILELWWKISTCFNESDLELSQGFTKLKENSPIFDEWISSFVTCSDATFSIACVRMMTETFPLDQKYLFGMFRDLINRFSYCPQIYDFVINWLVDNGEDLSNICTLAVNYSSFLHDSLLLQLRKLRLLQEVAKRDPSSKRKASTAHSSLYLEGNITLFKEYISFCREFISESQAFELEETHQRVLKYNVEKAKELL